MTDNNWRKLATQGYNKWLAGTYKNSTSSCPGIWGVWEALPIGT